MNKNTIYMIILLTVIWIILRESVNALTIAVGVALSTCCVLLSRHLIPLSRTEDINPFRLLFYLAYLFGQIYVGGIAVIRIILLGAHVEIVKVDTLIRNKVLRTILVNSITLVPGSISLDLKDNIITVLRFKDKVEELSESGMTSDLLKDKLEKMLLKTLK